LWAEKPTLATYEAPFAIVLRGLFSFNFNLKLKFFFHSLPLARIQPPESAETSYFASTLGSKERLLRDAAHTGILS
jgi:hypothetical protein